MPKTKKYTIKDKRFRDKLKRNIHLALVPHRYNNYRPYLIRRYGLMVVIGLVIGLQFSYNYTNTGSVLGKVTNVTANSLLADTNDVRSHDGLTPLKLNTKLTQAAEMKAQDMIDKGYWSHNSPSGVEPWYWVDQSGYSYQEAGENLAKNFNNSKATIDAWMNSQTHRDNILKPAYKDVGFAVKSGDLDGQPVTIIVALYAEPTLSAVSGVSTAKNTYVSDNDYNLSLGTRFGIMLESLTPAAIISVGLLIIAATVAVTAHIYRSKLPKKLQNTWYKHHGAAKASGLFVIAAFIVLIYGGGGQI